jgi:hypothetical protein
MTQNDFNSSFASLMVREFGPGANPEAIAMEIFRRDQRRTRFYAIVSLFFWLIGTAGMLLMVIGLNRLVIFLRIAHFEQAWNGQWTPQDQHMLLWGTDFIHHTLPYAGGGVIALLLAALFTVLYISSSRQQTLTRINISLMQMAEELKRMRDYTAK